MSARDRAAEQAVMWLDRARKYAAELDWSSAIVAIQNAEIFAEKAREATS
jgi:hypothetical protein